MFDIRCEEDIFVKEEVDINSFKETCQEMSALVHYLAREMYNIPDEENLIYKGRFKYKGYTWSHYYNVICNRIVDSTIMQFKNLSPYDNHDECYEKIEQVEFSDATIKNEIELYEVSRFIKDYSNKKYSSDKKASFFKRLVKHIKK